MDEAPDDRTSSALASNPHEAGPAPPAPLRVGVLASGRGSNLQAILDAAQSGELAADIAIVISDRQNAPALERARRSGVHAEFIDPGRYRTRLTPETEAHYLERLENHAVDLIVLAGFMRILHDSFLDAYTGRIINIHPSLLPSFPGLDAQGQAFDAGVKLTGATVHFVDSGIDQGPIIAQRAVPVLETDDRDTLADRILATEHRLLVDVLQSFAHGRVTLRDRRVTISPAAGTAAGGGPA